MIVAVRVVLRASSLFHFGHVGSAANRVLLTRDKALFGCPDIEKCKTSMCTHSHAPAAQLLPTASEGVPGPASLPRSVFHPLLLPSSSSRSMDGHTHFADAFEAQDLSTSACVRMPLWPAHTKGLCMCLQHCVGKLVQARMHARVFFGRPQALSRCVGCAGLEHVSVRAHAPAACVNSNVG